MKKIIKIAIIIGVCGLCFFGIYKYVNRVTGYTEIASFNEVDTNKLISVTLGRESCSWCQKFKPILDEIAVEKQVNLYYMDTSNIDSEHNYQIPTRCADFAGQTLLDGFGTPLTLFIENNEVVGCVSGYKELDAFKSILRTNDILK